MIGRCEAERKGESLLLSHGQFAFYDFYLDSIGVSECLSLIVDDYVYTGGETRVTKTVAIFSRYFVFVTTPTSLEPRDIKLITL